MKNEYFVATGKAGIFVGAWLGLLSFAQLATIIIAGHRKRARKSDDLGYSIQRWEPEWTSNPSTEEEWQKAFDEYKQSPEYV